MAKTLSVTGSNRANSLVKEEKNQVWTCQNKSCLEKFSYNQETLLQDIFLGTFASVLLPLHPGMLQDVHSKAHRTARKNKKKRRRNSCFGIARNRSGQKSNQFQYQKIIV